MCYWKIIAFAEVLLFSSVAFAPPQYEVVKIYTHKHFLENFLTLTDAEIAVNYAQHYPSVNISADSQSATPLFEMNNVKAASANSVVLSLDGKTWSERVFQGQPSYKFWNRTISAILVARAVLKGDYQWLAPPWEKPGQRTEAGINRLRTELLNLLGKIYQNPSDRSFSARSLDLVLVFLAAHDSLKDKDSPFYSSVEKYLTSKEHDAALAELIERSPSSFPELMRIDANDRELLTSVISGVVNLGHYMQLEGNVNGYQKGLTVLNGLGSRAMALYLAHFIPDMGGVAGLMKGSALITEAKTLDYVLALQSIEHGLRKKDMSKGVKVFIELLARHRYFAIGLDYANLSHHDMLLIVLCQHVEAYDIEKMQEVKTALDNLQQSHLEEYLILLKERVTNQVRGISEFPIFTVQMGPYLTKATKDEPLSSRLLQLAEIHKVSRNIIEATVRSGISVPSNVLVDLGTNEFDGIEYFAFGQVNEKAGEIDVYTDKTIHEANSCPAVFALNNRVNLR